MLILSQLVFLTAFNIQKIFANDSVKELPHCDDGKTGLVLISTLDGKLSALDSSGDLKWEFISTSGALLKSSIHDFEISNNGERVRIIPSLTGSLYKFNGRTIDALPISADHLLRSSALYTSGLVIAGGRELRTYGIDLRTGRSLYECDMSGCRNTTTNDPSSDGNETDGLQLQSQVQDVLLLERNTVTLRSHEPRQGKEMWNVSVAQHNIRMPQSHCINVDADIAGLHLRAILPEGVVSARTFHPQEEESTVKWHHNLGSPIVNVWTWDGKDLLDVDLFINEVEQKFVGGQSTVNAKKNLVPTPALYLAVHQKQMYIHESRKMLEMLRVSPNGGETNPYVNNQIMSRPSKHTIFTATIPFDHDQALALYRNDWDIVNGNGYYLYTEEDKQKPKLFDNCTEKLGGFQVVKQYTAILSALLQSVPAIILTVFLYYLFFVRPRRQAGANQSEGQGSTVSTNATSSYLPIHNNSVVTVPVPPCCTNDEVELLPVNKPTSVEIPEEPIYIEREFVSRYANDFETLQSLGKGGFGVVFEVKQKIDECRYAIKRITIPDKERNKRVVLREVQALAKLDHAHIVRYFNSWIEHPPPDWVKEHDRAFFEPDEITHPFSPSSGMTESHHTHHANISWPSGSPRTEAENASESREKLKSQNTDTIVVDLTKDRDSTTSSSSSSSSSDGIVFERATEDEDCDEFSICERQEVTNEATDKRRSKYASVCLYIQMQLCRKESLRDWLNQHRKERNRSTTMQMFKQIVDAVGYVHEHGLIHRDLKPNNVFFAMSGAIKIGDFGLVKTMADLKTDIEDSGRHSSAMYRSHTREVGTHLYMSPEQAAGNRYNYKVDVYALGIILFELLMPFETDSERIRVLQHLRQHTYPQSFENNFGQEKELLNRMLAKDPHERPSTPDIQTVPFIFNA